MPKQKRIVTEDYFRVLKERKEIEKRGRSSVGKLPAAASHANFDSLGGGGESNRKASPEKFGMPYWLSLIDPEMEDEEALKFIELPQETMYLIDKVVRQKARAGPIGIDNSEFINIEIEEEYKQKNKYIQGLVDGYKKREEQEEEEDSDQENDGNKEN